MRITRFFPLFSAILLTVWPAVCGAQSGELVLADTGRSEYRIVTPARPAPPETFAAQELQKYLARISGVTLPIESRAAPPAILVGRRDETTEGLLRGRNADSFAVHRSGKDLYLAGNTPLGTLYAVYYFLEKYLGCGWLRPGDEVVPQKERVAVPGSLQDVEEPKFGYRNLNLYPFILERSLRNVDWVAKNRLNWVHACTNSSNLWEEFASRRTLVQELQKRALYLNYGGHTFNAWVSPRKYFYRHPEYFSLLKGKRDPAQLCVSNPEVVRTAAENISRFLDQNPEVEMIDIWLNDVSQWCECDNCKRMEGRERPSIFGSERRATFMTRTNSNIKFVNAVAREVAKRHPKVLVQTLAYFMVIDAPDIEPEKNVVVGFAPISRQSPRYRDNRTGYWYPLYLPDHEINRKHLGELEKWLKIIPAERFFTYEYYSNYTTALRMINMHTTAENLEAKLIDPTRLTFHVYTDAMAKDIWYYTQIGVKGIGTEEWDWNELNMYSYARLLWHPELSANSLVADYCRRAYGAAAPAMLKHWLVIQEAKEHYRGKKQECHGLLKAAKTMTSNPDELRRIQAVEEVWSHIAESADR